jgi:sarcosine oxidase, subunit delta
MLLIECPWCGPRPETDFTYGGEAHIARPSRPEACSDEEWGDYLYMRSNPRGLHREQWCHSAGCRRWFTAERDTVSYRFTHFYRSGAPPDADRE